MSRKIEQLLRLVADMQNFSNASNTENERVDLTELSYEDLNLVSAASSLPQCLPQEEDKQQFIEEAQQMFAT